MSGGNGGGRSTAIRLIDQLLTLAGPGAELDEAIEREWASATFSGARHIVTLTVPSNTADTATPHWLTGISEHDFHLPRAFVADAIGRIGDPVAIGAGRWQRRCQVELLTVLDDIN